MSVTQVRNPEQVDLLRADFQARYEPNFAWKSAASCLLALSALRGAWVTSVRSGGHWLDISLMDMHLTYNGNPTFNYDGLVGYWDLDGTGDYFNHVDHADLDITATETYIAAAAQGLTLGGWFWFDNITANTWDGIIGKHNSVGVNQRAYLIIAFDAATQVEFQISPDGIASVAVASNETFSVSQWYFLVGRFVPSTTVDLFVNRTKYTNAAGIPAAIFNSNAAFEVGRRNNAGTEMTGRAAYCFLCAAALSDAQILALFNQQRAAFGV